MKNGGFSLVELMASVLISVIVMTLFFRTFLENLRYVTYSENKSSIQNSAQNALFFIKSDLRKAASGLFNKEQTLNFIKKSGTSMNNSSQLESFNVNFTRCKMFCNENDLCTAVSWDTAVEEESNNQSTCILYKGDVNVTNARFDINLYIKPQRFVMATGDCNSEPCTSEGSGLDNSDVIAVIFDPQNNLDCANNPVDDGSLTANRYFIYKENDLDYGSLYCQGFDPISGNPWGDAEEIVRGVHTLQALYAYSDNGVGVTSYRKADDIVNWWQVKGVQIGIITYGEKENQSLIVSQKSISLMGESYSNDFDGRTIYGFTMIQNFDLNRNSLFWRDKIFY